MNKTISMLLVAGTLVAALAIAAIDNIQSVDAASRRGFGEAVNSQAKAQDEGSFGEHQSGFAQQGGLGQFNRR